MKQLRALVTLSFSLLLVGSCGNDSMDMEVESGPDAGIVSPDASPDLNPDSGSTVTCVVPIVPALEDIPDNPVLMGNTLYAALEVDGDTIVSKYIRDTAAGEGALKLWQQLVLRIPANQRLDLVEFQVFENSDPAGFMSGTTGSATGRYGYTLSVTKDYIDLSADPCDMLTPRRGNYGWTLIHEYGHMRSVLDGTLDVFTVDFTHRGGDGAGYPEDGSPMLTGDYVSSYAERSSGDEDYAESFTTFVMLDVLPTELSKASLKVNWFEQQSGYPELRKAMRITETDGSAAALMPAPRAEFPFVITPASWILGTWRGVANDGTVLTYEFTPDNITLSQTPTGGSTSTVSYKDLRDDGILATILPYDNNESAYGYHVSIGRYGGGTEYHYRDSSTQMHSEVGSMGQVNFTKVE